MADFKVKNFRKIPFEQLESLIENFIEIELIEPFQVIRETLTRIGVLKRGALYQTAHILHKKEKYYIVHFKQLFALDGRDSTLDEDDTNRLFKIANLLEKWNLIRFIKEEDQLESEEHKDVFVNIAKVYEIKDGKVILKKKYDLWFIILEFNLKGDYYEEKNGFCVKFKFE